MNQKEYKAIAGIISNHIVKEKDNYQYYLSVHLGVVEALADYFEKKDIIKFDNNADLCLFNKEQFLKDCGVK